MMHLTFLTWMRECEKENKHFSDIYPDFQLGILEKDYQLSLIGRTSVGKSSVYNWVFNLHL